MIAKTIGKEQTQQVHRVFYHASLQKSASVPCTLLKGCRASKPSYDLFPVPIQQRFVSHPTLNHKSIPASKNFLTPMRTRGDEPPLSGFATGTPIAFPAVGGCEDARIDGVERCSEEISTAFGIDGIW